MQLTKAKPSSLYTEIASYFLKMGFLGFGGPLALMAAIQKDLVLGAGWTTPERFAQGLALIKAMPGPTGTQMAVYMGQIRGGRLGGLIAGVCLILPAFFMMLVLAAFYDRVENLAWSTVLLFGMQAAALGVILDSVWKLSAAYRKEKAFWTVALLAAALTIWRPSSEPLVIVGAGMLGILMMRFGEQYPKMSKTNMFFPFSIAAAQGAAFGAAPQVGLSSASLLTQLGVVCLKAGTFVFGTGLAIVPLLAHDVVETHHWLSQRQFMDALAFGQITPGPVVVTATFIGYKVAALKGAIVATVAIFAPAFFNILTWFPLVEKKFGSSLYARRFVMWAVGAVVGSIVVTVVRLSLSAASTSLPLDVEYGAPLLLVSIVIGSLVAALLTRLPVWIIIPAGGMLAASALLFQYV